MNFLEIRAKFLRDDPKLVAYREIDVPPGIGIQLRQLGFNGAEENHRRTDAFENLSGAFGCHFGEYADKLRQFFQLFDGLALDDPLRAISQIDTALPHGAQLAAETVRHSRKNRTPEHQ